jgi:hypothetical protein
MFLHPIDYTVVRIRALVIALEPFPALITRDAKRNAVFRTELFQLGHDARGDDGCGFGVEQVHERFVEFKFAAHRVREEVCVDEDRVRGPEGRVGLEEECRGDLGAREVLDWCVCLFVCGYGDWE